MTPDQALSFWHLALAEEFGWCIPISGGLPALRKAQKILYDARTKSKDERLKSLMLCLPGGAKEIWLVKQEVELENA